MRWKSKFSRYLLDKGYKEENGYTFTSVTAIISYPGKERNIQFRQEIKREVPTSLSKDLGPQRGYWIGNRFCLEFFVKQMLRFYEKFAQDTFLLREARSRQRRKAIVGRRTKRLKNFKQKDGSEELGLSPRTKSATTYIIGNMLTNINDTEGAKENLPHQKRV